MTLSKDWLPKSEEETDCNIPKGMRSNYMEQCACHSDRCQYGKFYRNVGFHRWKSIFVGGGAFMTSLGQSPEVSTTFTSSSSVWVSLESPWTSDSIAGKGRHDKKSALPYPAHFRSTSLYWCVFKHFSHLWTRGWRSHAFLELSRAL